MIKGLDYSFSKPGEQAVKDAGYDFVCRYLSGGNKKDISGPEAKAIKAAGLKLALVWESTAARALDGHQAGIEDATRAQAQAVSVGCGDIPAIYFAVDFDATPAQQASIDDYLRGVATVIGLPRTGVYGGYWVVKRCFDHGVISFGWQTYAWSGGNWDPRAQLRQVLNGQKLNGADVDIDHALSDNYGQWSITNQNIVDPIADFKNCYITQVQAWPSDADVAAWQASGLAPYTWVQRNAPNPAVGDLTAQLNAKTAQLQDANDQIKELQDELAHPAPAPQVPPVVIPPATPPTARISIFSAIIKLISQLFK